MEADLTALEAKVSQLIGLCQQLRTENMDLRQALAQAQSDVKQLNENMTLAGNRLQALLQSLPEDSDE
jgi:cell division protein ZapB